MIGPNAASPIGAFAPEIGLEAPTTMLSLVGGGGGVVVGGVVVGGVVVSGGVVGHPIATKLMANNSANGINSSFLFTYISPPLLRIRFP